ncbi:MAG: hypothetical protein WA047_09770 [Phenylobacterium sp.]|uniref:hypothetical protein n=1 Tax=Phenylobacterium sp. TaxID=1871053 RepID=UPI003BB6D871
MRNLLTATALAALLAGCNQQSGGQTEASSSGFQPPAAPAAALAVPAPAAGGFSHVKGEDVFGYYIPNTEVKVGNWRLENISFGLEEDFTAWEGGAQDGPAGPIMFDFVDVTSANGENEMGQTTYAKTIRVLPTSYKIGGGDLKFTGKDATLGVVQLDGTIDMAALKRARTAGPGAQETILRTGLMVGSTPFKNLSFNWFGGD